MNETTYPSNMVGGQRRCSGCGEWFKVHRFFSRYCEKCRASRPSGAEASRERHRQRYRERQQSSEIIVSKTLLKEQRLALKPYTIIKDPIDYLDGGFKKGVRMTEIEVETGLKLLCFAEGTILRKAGVYYKVKYKKHRYGTTEQTSYLEAVPQKIDTNMKL